MIPQHKNRQIDRGAERNMNEKKNQLMCIKLQIVHTLSSDSSSSSSSLSSSFSSPTPPTTVPLDLHSSVGVDDVESRTNVLNESWKIPGGWCFHVHSAESIVIFSSVMSLPFLNWSAVAWVVMLLVGEQWCICRSDQIVHAGLEA